MLNLNSSTKFKKDFKLCVKRGYNMKLLQEVIDTLRIPVPLAPLPESLPFSLLHPANRTPHPSYLSTSTISSENIPDVLIVFSAFSFSSIATVSPFLRVISLHFLPLFKNL